MSGRLFTEVRESAACAMPSTPVTAVKRIAALSWHMPAPPHPAQETLDVTRHELARLSEGVTESEFQRAIVGMKSRLVMQGESTGARAGAIARDQYVLGHPRTLDELAQKVDAITLDKLNDFLATHPLGEATTVTIGPNPLDVDTDATLSRKS